MPKHEANTPKAIANRIKSKGLQKLRFYCQMCQKQCRDQNGFKCHLSSESHQRQLLLFADNQKSYMGEFNSEFQKGFMDILRRQHGTKRVHANLIYQEYIKDRNHIHMNSTSWHTLTGFVNFLARVGICKVDQTEKGWYIQYIDREEEERREKLVKKQKMDKDDDERIQELVLRQAERAKQQLEERDGKKPEDDMDGDETNAVCEDDQGESTAKLKEFKKEDEEQKIGFQMTKSIVKKEIAEAVAKPILKRPKPDNNDDAMSMISTASKREKASSSSSKPTALDEIRAMEEKRKETANRKDYWLHEGIVVKVVTKRLGDKYYKRKGVVEQLADKYTAEVRLFDDDGSPKGELLKMDQAHLETVIPAVGKRVMIVNGAYRGLRAVLDKLDVDNFSVRVKIDEGPTKGRVVDRVQYEDVSKLHLE